MCVFYILVIFFMITRAWGAVVLTEDFESGLDTATWQTFSDSPSIFYPEASNNVGPSGKAPYAGYYLRAATVDQANNLGDQRNCGIIYKLPINLTAQPVKISWQGFEWADAVGFGLTADTSTNFDSMTAVYLFLQNTDVTASVGQNGYDTITDNHQGPGAAGKPRGTAAAELTIERIASGLYGVNFSVTVNTIDGAEDFATLGDTVILSPGAAGQEIWHIPDGDAQAIHLMFIFRDSVPNAFSMGNDIRIDNIRVELAGAGPQVGIGSAESSVSISWQTENGNEYVVATTDDMTSNWSDVAVDTGTGYTMNYTDVGDTARANPGSDTVTQRFYSVRRTK